MIPRSIPQRNIQTYVSGRTSVYDGTPRLLLGNNPQRISAQILNTGPGDVLISANPIDLIQGFGSKIAVDQPSTIAGNLPLYGVAIPESFVAANSTLFVAWGTGNLDPLLFGQDLATDITVTETVAF